MAHAVDGALAPVAAAIVDDPEHPPGRGAGLGGHLFDEAAERLDTGGLLAAAEDPGPCTSQAARYARAPPRLYSCSTPMSRVEAGARVA